MANQGSGQKAEDPDYPQCHPKLQAEVLLVPAPGARTRRTLHWSWSVWVSPEPAGSTLTLRKWQVELQTSLHRAVWNSPHEDVGLV